jgi:Caspase domain
MTIHPRPSPHQPLAVSLLLLCILGGFTPMRAADRALVVGVEKYADSRVPETPGCVLDATQTAAFLQSRYGFAASSIKVLTNEQATAGSIEQEFRRWLIEGTQPGDRVFVLYAGHGAPSRPAHPPRPHCHPATATPYDVNPETGSGEVRVRGALSFVFADEQQGALPTLKELNVRGFLSARGRGAAARRCQAKVSWIADRPGSQAVTVAHQRGVIARRAIAPRVYG